MPKVEINKCLLRIAMNHTKRNKYRRRIKRSKKPTTPLDCVRIAIFWLMDSTKSRKRRTLKRSKKTKPDYRTHKPFYIKLANQIIATSLGKGSAIKKKRALRKFLESLKYYRHYITTTTTIIITTYLNNERKKQ
uniref:Ribosomal protein S7 n=1 Tax=Karlodinium veneficum TaxID=407301 RepID=G1E775_KARVE|nr:ribosomal protein S7 [Karlodinium veneficum]